MRIAIVNDVSMLVEMLSRIVEMDPGCHVAWTARDGAEAVRNCAMDVPDLLIMDLFMPIMDGTEATRRIMTSSPCPILIVTASVDSNSSKVFETLGAGALDAIATPAIGNDGKCDGMQPLLRKIAQFKQLIAPSSLKLKRRESVSSHLSSNFDLVVVGSSTGGPNALADLFSQIPASINAAFVVIQHVDKQFAPGLASWLNSICALEVCIAKAGDRPQRGKVMIAATNDHLVMNCGNVFQYTPEPENNPFRPSVDVFFNSVACKCREKGIAVLLTGIGRDGAVGLLTLRQSGWRTFAQNKETCVVYGMPKAAAELGGAGEVLSPKDIGQRIVGIVGVGSEVNAS